MNKTDNMFRDIEKTISNLDKYYGGGKYNKKDTLIGSIIITCMLVYFTFMSFKSINISLLFIPFIYFTILTFSILLTILIGFLFDNPKNINSNKKKKYILTFLFEKSLLFLFITLFPIIVIASISDKISVLLGIQILTKNIHIILLDLLIYIIAYLSCLGYKIHESNIFEYIFTIWVIYSISYFLRKKIFYLNTFISFREMYEYFYKSRSVMMYIINILTIFCSVAGLYISKYNNDEFSSIIIYNIMPIIIFTGLEQIIIYIKQNKNEKTKFIQNMYEELLILNDIAYNQISNYSCMKINIKISTSPYVIENYKNHFFSYEKKKDRMIIEILDKCEYMLKKEYKIYIKEEKLNFEKDLYESINGLAKCLIIMK